MALALAAGAALGVSTLRLGGHYLAMVTISFQQILTVVLINAIGFTHGPDGVSSIGRPAGFASGQAYLALAVAALAISGYLVWRLADTRLGRAMRAVRDNELAASAAGIDVFRTKVIAFALGALLGGLGGGLFAGGFSYISPDQFAFSNSIVLLTMALLGGVSSPIGSTIGTGLLILIPEWLRFLKSVPGLYLAIYGVAVILIVVFMPEGIWGFVGRLFRDPQARPVEVRRAAHLASRQFRRAGRAGGQGPRQEFRRTEGGRRSRFSGAARRRACADRSEWQRQDDDAQCGDRALSRDGGRNPRRRRRRDRAARAQAHHRRPRAHVPEHSAVPLDDRARKCRDRRRARRQRARRRRDTTRCAAAPAPRSTSSGWGAAPTRQSRASATAINA